MRRVAVPSPEEHALARRLIAETGVADGAAFVARPEILQALVDAIRHGAALQWSGDMAEGGRPIRYCRVCGCSDNHVCVVDGEPCHWVALGLCSACAPYTEGQ